MFLKIYIGHRLNGIAVNSCTGVLSCSKYNSLTNEIVTGMITQLFQKPIPTYICGHIKQLHIKRLRLSAPAPWETASPTCLHSTDFAVSFINVSEVQLQKALDTTSKNFDPQVQRGMLNGAGKEPALQHITPVILKAEGVAGGRLLYRVKGAAARIRYTQMCSGLMRTPTRITENVPDWLLR